MRNDAAADIEALFNEAAALDREGRARFLDDVRARDRGQAELLEQLLAADSDDTGRVPQDPRLTAAQVAARNVLGSREPAELDPESREVLDRLAARGAGGARYTLGEEIGRGGMGAVLAVWDQDLKRELAMKVALGETVRQDGLGSIAIERFLEEAQVTGQLDHPGIVPVHELGLDADGQVFFTMRLVRGRPLDEILELVREEREGWTVVRALGVLLKVCEAMSYAHAKGVVHRDLKPANVMVGRFGEVYVMDWGVARVLEAEERAVPGEHTRAIRSARARRRGERTEDPLATRQGVVLGTPAYMPPEQARGEYDLVDARSDVYAVGAMLYQLLTGDVPYHRPGERLESYVVLSKVLQGPPTPIAERAPRVPPELIAICETAMARELGRRYPDMQELARDLQAYLENRVVRAYATGPLFELKKWILRNRATAAAGILAFLLVLAGGAVSFLQAKRLRAEQEARDYRLFLKYAQLEEAALRVDSSEMWPATPDKLPIYDAWLGQVDEWLSGADEIREKLRQRRASGSVTWYPSPEGQETRSLVELAEGEPAGSATIGGELEVWDFENPEDRWLHDQTARLARTIERFEDPERGLIEGISKEHGWGVARRRQWAAQVSEQTVTGPFARARWLAAIEEIADHSDYGGLVLEPQLGLLPLGPDPYSGLWEFCLLQTGEAPERDEDDSLVLTGETGLVFVLVPGGTFVMGAQLTDPVGLNFDELAQDDEYPPHEVELSPFFLSKYEMNLAQWARLTGEIDSVFGDDPWYPIQRIRWEECVRTLGWVGCTLPTEAQWEYAARSGTDTRWWTGSTVASLQGCGNLSDRSLQTSGIWTDRVVEEELDDGSPYIAKADAYEPNYFGLHGIIGNVWEWCLDEYSTEVYRRGRQRDPLVPPKGEQLIARGGSYLNMAMFARSSNRSRFTPDFSGQRLGVRPARRIQGELRYR